MLTKSATSDTENIGYGREWQNTCDVDNEIPLVTLEILAIPEIIVKDLADYCQNFPLHTKHSPAMKPLPHLVGKLLIPMAELQCPIEKKKSLLPNTGYVKRLTWK